MIKKLLAVFVFLFIIHNSPFIIPAYAAGEFSASYNVNYDVDASGSTQVTENIDLKNLTDRYFASSFTLTIGSTKLEDVSATDSQGIIPVDVQNQGNKTVVNVKFTQQIAGKDKDYPWTLKFKSNDFAQAQGKVWQVSVPKISDLQDLDSYNLTLSVPESFGDPTSILPEPQSFKSAGGKIVYSFTKNQLTDSGILANFGTNQLFDFNLDYNFENTGILPAIAKLPLPPDTDYQQVQLNNFSPKPDNVLIDADGNYIAYFNIGAKQNLDVKVSGLAKLYINKYTKPGLLTDTQFKSYTQSQKYWEADNPLIKSKLEEILQGKNAQTNTDKAKLIYQFVVNDLQYDQGRIKNNDFQRLGAVTTLTNPTTALCSEFTDLFVALARAANIPADMLVGYAYTSNTDLRPLSLGSKSILHAWPQFYDPQTGWQMIDPTWGNTTGGVDYFSKFDLNHFVLGIRGTSSENPIPADQVQVKFTDAQFSPASDASMTLVAPDTILAGFPAHAKVLIQNTGNSIYQGGQFNLTANNLILGNSEYQVGQIPPFGNVQYQFTLRSKSIWQQSQDQLTATLGDKTLQQPVLVKPFFAYQNFSLSVFGLIAVMLLSYLLTFIIHQRVKFPKKPHKS